MLADITIEDLGVIHHASAELSSGLTVLTGETGAALMRRACVQGRKRPSGKAVFLPTN